VPELPGCEPSPP
jgi:hypothetical protein